MPYPHVLEMVHSFSGRKKDLIGSRLLLAQATNPCTELFCPLAHFSYDLCANFKKDVLTRACRLQVTDTIPLERKEAEL